MFAVPAIPEWAECGVSSVAELAPCTRSVTKMVSALVQEEGTGAPQIKSLGVCNRHVELVEAAFSPAGGLPCHTVSRAEFPAFMQDLMESAGIF